MSFVTEWQIAERQACAWMRSHGFPDAALTGAGADEGADITSRTAVAQVKAQVAAVGRPAIQALHGVAGASGRQPLFFSTSGYTNQARQWAAAAGVALFTLEEDGVCQPDSPRAHDIIRAVPRTPGTPWRPDPGRTHRQNKRSLRRDVAKTASLTTARGTRKHLADVIRYLQPGEDVRAVAKVNKGLGTRVLVVTNRRLMILDQAGMAHQGQSVQLWGLHALAITDRGKMTFTVDGRTFKFTGIRPADRDELRRWLKPSGRQPG